VGGMMRTSSRNVELDALRAGSVLLVVFAHSRFSFVPGGLGVTIFFVISGYIITKLILNEVTRNGDISLWKFYLRRFWKLAPPFLLIIVVPSILTWKVERIDLTKFLSQILFFFNWIKISSGSDGVMRGTSVVWSLSIEEQFYVVVALFACVARYIEYKTFSKYLLAVFLAAWVFSTTSRIYHSYIGQNNNIYDATGNLPRIYLGTDTRMSSICAGAILAIVSQNVHYSTNLKLAKNNWLYILSFVVSTMFIVSLTIRNPHFRDILRFSLQELATCLLITLGPILGWTPKILRRIIQLRLVQIIGRSSYCIYLSHLMLLLFFQTLTTDFEGPFLILIELVIAAITLFIGVLLYLTTDKPFERMRTRFRR
jgi:peptidoglycan/LPS O-acetylase OafA/YrhL